MRSTCRKDLAIAFLVLCQALSPGHGRADEYDGQPIIELHVVGADSMDFLMGCWKAAHEVRYPNVSIEYSPALSADGARAMIDGRADLAPFAREFFPKERAAFDAAFGRPPTLVRVAGGSFASRGKTHALAVYVNRDNPLRSITIAELRKIFAGGSSALGWGDLGLAGEWRSAPVNAYGMINLRASGNPPGIVNFLRDRINAGQPLNDSIVQLPGTNEVHALQQIVDRVAGDRYGIGYSGFGFTNPDARALALRNDAGALIAGSPASVASHEYSLSRFVYLAIRPNLEAPRLQAVADLMRTILGRPGQDCVGRDAAGFFPLPNDVVTAERRQLPGPGSRAAAEDENSVPTYWTDDGRVRVVGYNDMEQMLRAMNEQFTTLHPEIEFELDLRGTRAGPPALMDGSSAFAPMGAEFSDAALTEFRQRVGTEPLAVRVAHASLSPAALSGPLGFFVHARNPLTSISLSNARRIFVQEDDVQPIERWGQLGLQGAWANRSIQPCGLSAHTALARYLLRHKFDGLPMSDAVTGFGQSRDAVQFAAANTDALCFAAHNRRTPDVKPLAVSADNEAPAYAATAETLTNGLYPLDRYLYIYVRQTDDDGIDPLVREYLELVLSPVGQATIAAGTRGYLPLSRSESEAELARLASGSKDRERASCIEHSLTRSGPI